MLDLLRLALPVVEGASKKESSSSSIVPHAEASNEFSISSSSYGSASKDGSWEGAEVGA